MEGSKRETTFSIGQGRNEKCLDQAWRYYFPARRKRWEKKVPRCLEPRCAGGTEWGDQNALEVRLGGELFQIEYRESGV